MIFESVRLSLVLSMSRQAAATVMAELRQKPALLRVLRNSPRAMPLSGLPITVMTALYTSRKQGKLQRACAVEAPGFTCADRGVLPPSFFMDVVAELRHGPAQLRVLRNSPRAMPLSGLPIMVMTVPVHLMKTE